MLAGSIARNETQNAIYAPMIFRDKLLGVVHVDSCISTKAFDDGDLNLVMTLAYQAAMYIKFYSYQTALHEESALRTNMLRWFSPKVAKKLASSGNVQLESERVNATILCSDIRGFTVLAKRMDPGETVKLLNETFEAIVPIIFKYDGTVDKYIGDSVLAVFGSPERDPQQCEHAVRAALEMQAALAQLGQALRFRGREPFEIGIGIHTGEVIHGMVGAQDRMEYTVIGNAVNAASVSAKVKG